MIFLRKLSLGYALILFCFFSTIFCTCPGINETQLELDRIDFAPKWVEKPNGGQSLNDYYIDTYAIVNFTYGAATIGKFFPRYVAKEYTDLVFLSGGGLPPQSVINITADRVSITKLDTDLYTLKYTLNASSGWNITANRYNYRGEGFRDQTYITFAPCTLNVTNELIISDPLSDQFFRIAAQTSISYSQACNGILGAGTFPGACPAGTPNYGSTTGYDNFTDCMNYFSSKPAVGICPFFFISDTTLCRILHEQAAFNLPEIHCPHVAKDSTVCIDSCLPTCGNCGANAHCLGSIATNGTITYACICNDGYTGDGVTCTRDNCTAIWQCPFDSKFGVCSDGVCKCNTDQGFVWDSSQSALLAGTVCDCPLGTVLQWDHKQAYCLPKGRCKKQSQCPQTDYNSVRCVTYGDNFLEIYDTCVCNYGYDGGFDSDCICMSPRRTVSTDAGSKICIATGECLEDRHCWYPSYNGQHCTVPSGSPIGTCA